MKSNPDCIPCVFRQALRVAKMISDDPQVHLDCMIKVADHITKADFDNNPSVLSQPVYDIANAINGGQDLFAQEKADSNRLALSIKPILKKMIDSSTDPLDTALHAAAAGNTIDLGAGHDFNIEEDIVSMVNAGFAINDIDTFRKELCSGKKLLYIGDNAGEIVFDSLLVEEILKTGTKVTFSVKSDHIINDATMKDAIDTGLTEVTEVIETGGADIGINWSNVSDEFRTVYNDADVIIAKGHGNFETLVDQPENIYFLLKAKCAYVASTLDINEGDIAFKHTADS